MRTRKFPSKLKAISILSPLFKPKLLLISEGIHILPFESILTRFLKSLILELDLSEMNYITNEHNTSFSSP